MRFVRYRYEGEIRLGVWEGSEVTDITELGRETFRSFVKLVDRSTSEGVSVVDFVSEALESSDTLFKLPFEELEANNEIAIPVSPPEIWACGVTYKRSQAARESETGTKGIYNLVYDAERPEVFFKGTESRCVGPNEEIGIRGDSFWNVPEPELAFILDSNRRIIGFTIGNDVSSRDIEGANPLYLPQAKIFEGCCALGPSIVTTDEVGTEPDLEIECGIIRSGETIFRDSIRTSRMKRSIEDLRSYLCMYNPVPAGTVCLTGTGIVPPDDFSLMEKDVVEIKIEKIGTLRNKVRKLKQRNGG